MWNLKSKVLRISRWFQTHLTLFKTLITILVFFIVTIVWTWGMIYIHTPQPSLLTFNFSCTGDNLPCDGKISEQDTKNTQENIKTAIKNSHRFGKLSEIYLSILKFEVGVRNQSDAFIKIPPHENTFHGFLSIQCGAETFSAHSVKQIESFFTFSDSVDPLIASVTDFVKSCDQVFFLNPDNAADLPPVPPDTTVSIDFGPKFLVEFEGDLGNWFIIWLFHTLILLGLLPVFRGGWQFFSNPMKYLDK